MQPYSPFGDPRVQLLRPLNHMLVKIDLLLMAVAVRPAVTRLVTDAASIYAEIFGVAEKAEAGLVVASHRPAMKDYLLGTNAAPVVRHARRSVLVARN